MTFSALSIGPDGDEYLDGEAFHRDVRRVYDGALDWAVNKQAGRMARVLYRAPHENRSETGTRRGAGNDWARWIFAEEPGIAEHIFTAPLELVIDDRLDPGAAIGLHQHRETEEVYYILEGTVTMMTVAADGREATASLSAGDAHAIKLGQSHFGLAGDRGVRFIAIAVRAM